MDKRELCCFKAPEKMPCPALADVRSPYGYCHAHDEIYLYDCAIAYRRKAKRDPEGAERWARGLRLPVMRLQLIASTLPEYVHPIALRIE